MGADEKLDWSCGECDPDSAALFYVSASSLLVNFAESSSELFFVNAT